MKNNISIKTVFTKMCLIPLLGMVTFLFYASISEYDNFAYYFLKIVDQPGYLVAFFTVVLTVVIYVIFKVINGCDEKKLKYIKYASAFVMLVLQIILIATIDIIQKTDPFITNDQALAIAKGTETFVDGNSEYFKAYGNNYFVAVVTAYFYKFLMFFGISNFNLIFEILNVLMIDLAVIILYRTVKIAFGDKRAVKVLLLSVLNPMNYVMIFWFYTATYSLPLMVGIVYLAISTWKNYESTNSRNYLKMAGIGILTVVGYFLRPTVLIPFIAVVICFVLTLKLNKKTLLKALTFALVFLVTSMLCYTLIHHQVYKYVEDDSDNFPMTHWVMMGLHEEGRVNMPDQEYTRSFEGKAAKEEANIKEIKSTLDELGVRGFLRHLSEKIKVTWTDGTGDYFERMQQSNNPGKIYDWVFGQRSGFLDVFFQVYRALMLGLAALGLLKQVLSKKYDTSFLFSLTLLGGIVFYLIWEAKEAYSLPFIPFLLVLSCFGMDIFCDSTEKIKVSYRRKIVIALTLVLQVVTLITGLKYQTGFTQDEFWWRDIVVKSDNASYMEFVGADKEQLEIQQNFYAKKNFNQIEIACQLNEDKYNVYTLELISDGEKLAEATISPDKVQDNKVTFSTGLQIPEGEQKYTLRIKAVETSQAIAWGMHTYKETDVYRGEAYINGEEKKMDLYMNVFNSYKGKHMGALQYWCVIIFVMFVEAVAEYVMLRMMKKEKV